MPKRNIDLHDVGLHDIGLHDIGLHDHGFLCSNFEFRQATPEVKDWQQAQRYSQQSIRKAD